MALLRPVTPLPQWLHGCFWLYILLRSERLGLGLTSPLFMSNKKIVVNGEMLSLFAGKSVQFAHRTLCFVVETIKFVDH